MSRSLLLMASLLVSLSTQATEVADSVVVAKARVTPASVSPTWQLKAAEPESLLRRLIENRSIRLFKVVDRPSRQVYFGIDSTGTVGMHVRMRGD